MLSYQHIYHAGNLADVHKHGLLAWVLDYMTAKDKPLTYIETHAGRGLYDLTDSAAQKTGEAAKGIGVAAEWFAADHPFARVLDRIRARHGDAAYPGSPVIAAECLRPIDSIHLAELHPQEAEALRAAMKPYGAVIRQQDGFAATLSLCPPEPRRGVLLIDPSFEVKADYQTIPKFIAQVHRKWNVGVIILWYPILTDNRHKPMLRALSDAIPAGMIHEVRFSPARAGHGMVGSGLFVVNAPFGFTDAATRLGALFAALPKPTM